jgi:RNA polymerase sigma factor (sigma-70 family)
MFDYTTERADGVHRFGQAQAGDAASLAELMRQHDGLVHHIVRRQSGGCLSYAEVLQAGRIGLWRAILHFDVTRGTAFSTYAGAAIAHQVWAAVRQGEAEEREAGERCRLCWECRGAGDQASDLLAGVVAEAVRTELGVMVARLPARQREIVRAYYGLDGQEAQTMPELAAELGCSKQAVHYHLRCALRRLRHPGFSAGLRHWLGLNRRADYRQALRPSRRRP